MVSVRLITLARKDRGFLSKGTCFPDYGGTLLALLMAEEA